MVGTTQLDRVRSIVDSIGARIVLMGDPRQLGAVGAGGAMGLVEGRAETYTLSATSAGSPRTGRPTASLRLRDGDRDALADYDRHGRLVEAATMDDAIAAAARAAAADRIAGLVRRRQRGHQRRRRPDRGRRPRAPRRRRRGRGRRRPARPHRQPRRHRRRGHDPAERLRPRRHQPAAVPRRRHRHRRDGRASLSVLGDDGAVRELPADYVERARPARLRLDRARRPGRHRRPRLRRHRRPLRRLRPLRRPHSRPRPQHRLRRARSPPTRTPPTWPRTAPRDRPPAACSRTAWSARTADRAALVEAEADAVREASMQDGHRAASSSSQQARCAPGWRATSTSSSPTGCSRPRTAHGWRADQSSEHLSRLLRAAEQAGHDPQQLLREAVAQRSLDDAQSVAQVLSHRITSAHDIETAAEPHRDDARATARRPRRVPSSSCTSWPTTERESSGHEVAEQQPAWATQGPRRGPGRTPSSGWSGRPRPAQVAAYREAAGFEEPDAGPPQRARADQHREARRVVERLGRPRPAQRDSEPRPP